MDVGLMSFPPQHVDGSQKISKRRVTGFVFVIATIAVVILGFLSAAISSNYNNTFNIAKLYKDSFPSAVIIIEPGAFKEWDRIYESAQLTLSMKPTEIICADKDEVGACSFHGRGKIDRPIANLYNCRTTIYVGNTSVKLSFVTIADGDGCNGGGLYLGYSDAELILVRFVNNFASNQGGGIFTYSRMNEIHPQPYLLTLKGCYFQGNHQGNQQGDNENLDIQINYLTNIKDFGCPQGFSDTAGGEIIKMRSYLLLPNVTNHNCE